MTRTRTLTTVLAGLALAVAVGAVPAAADHYSISDGRTCYGGEIATGTFVPGLRTSGTTPLRQRADGTITYSCLFTRLPAQVLDGDTVLWQRPTAVTTSRAADSCAVLAPGTTEELWFGLAVHTFSPGGALRLDCTVRPPA